MPQSLEVVLKALCDPLCLLCGSLCNFLKDCYTEVHGEGTEKHRVESDMINSF